MKRGVVVKSTGKFYRVLSEDGEEMECTIRGKFRTQGLRTTNPVAVGDHVEIDVEKEGIGVITHIDERKNYIIRKSVNLSKEAHIVASNIDQAILLITLKAPDTSFGFADRFLVTAEAYGIPVKMVINKMDVYDEKILLKVQKWIDIYTAIGYPCYKMSAETGEGIDAIIELMKDKVTLISGHSGAGKSTLVNRIEPGLQLKTSEVSESHNKGKHTTTFAEMFPLSIGGFIIDTPGIKGFGLVDMEKEMLSHYFPEMFELLSDCKFHNCQHMNEPGCAVKKALEAGEIAESRYKSYLSLLLDDEGTHYRQ